MVKIKIIIWILDQFKAMKASPYQLAKECVLMFISDKKLQHNMKLFDLLD